MMLRLVLVGMVAALGVTIPGGTNRGGWLVSAARWGSSVNLDWDAWRPDNRANQAPRVATTRHQCEQCRLARAAIALRERRPAPGVVATSTKSTSVQTGIGSEQRTADSHRVSAADSLRAPTLAFEPIDVANDFYTGIAFELNRNAEGIDLVQSPTAPTSSVARFEAVVLVENLETDLPAVLCGVTDEDDVEPASLAVASQPREENDPTASGTLISSETGDEFNLGETEATPTSEPDVSPVVAASVRAAAANDCPEPFEVFTCQTGPINEDDAPTYEEALGPAIVAAASTSSVVTQPAAPLYPVAPPVVAERTKPSLDQGAVIPWPAFAPDDTSSQPSTRVVQDTTVPWPVFAPIELTADSSRAAESFSSASAPRHGSSSNASWGQAVDLTRQAVSAWMHVLSGSARVEVTAR